MNVLRRDSADGLELTAEPGGILLSVKEFGDVLLVFCGEFEEEFKNELAENLLKLSSVPEFSKKNFLVAGRGGLSRLRVQGRNLVVRANRRGGFLRFFNRSKYFRFRRENWQDTRAVSELLCTARLKASSVKVPRPVAALIQPLRGRFYSSLFVTEEIANSKNLLLEAASLSETEIRRYCYLAGLEAKKMLAAGFLHRDLHPANVLYTDSADVYLIDFDKAFYLKILSKAANNFLVKRWARAVDKRLLPTYWKDEFISGLK